MTSTPPNPKPATPSSDPVLSLLHFAHPTSPTTAAQIYRDKLQHKHVPLLPTPKPKDNREGRRLQRLRKKEYYFKHAKAKPLSARRKRELGVHELRKEEIRYEVYEGLNQLWGGYMREVLGFTQDISNASMNANANAKAMASTSSRQITAQSHGSLIASADFHGASIEVVRSRCAGYVGVKGIVVRETKFTFVIVGRVRVEDEEGTEKEKDRCWTVPKRGSVFRVEVPLQSHGQKEGTDDQGRGIEQGDKKRKVVFELNGSALEVRPVDRATKKFKFNWKAMEDL